MKLFFSKLKAIKKFKKLLAPHLIMLMSIVNKEAMTLIML